MSAFHVSTYLDKIADKEKEQNSNILVGSIDSFTDGIMKSPEERYVRKSTC